MALETFKRFNILAGIVGLLVIIIFVFGLKKENTKLIQENAQLKSDARALSQQVKELQAEITSLNTLLNEDRRLIETENTFLKQRI